VASKPGAPSGTPRGRPPGAGGGHCPTWGSCPPDADILEMHLYREFFMHGTSHWLGLDVHDAGAYRTAEGPTAARTGHVFTVEPGIYIAPTGPRWSSPAGARPRRLDRAADPSGHRRRSGRRGRGKEAAEKITHRIPEEFLGIGIRIEDDILVTIEGHENLTSMVPTDPDKIEPSAPRTLLAPPRLNGGRGSGGHPERRLFRTRGVRWQGGIRARRAPRSWRSQRS
jgi:hypothetical protein